MEPALVRVPMLPVLSITKPFWVGAPAIAAPEMFVSVPIEPLVTRPETP